MGYERDEDHDKVRDTQGGFDARKSGENPFSTIDKCRMLGLVKFKGHGVE